MQFPRLKDIVKAINEIRPLDLAYFDKFKKYNRDVQYLLIAVDFLSQYLRVKPIKTKNASEAAADTLTKWSNIISVKSMGL